ncbi:MAG: DUF4199 domain-containing protein [Saprospiraceae bacterium]|nr:DUF4199 domain-containing protein [Saprospiraceae bacterium]
MENIAARYALWGAIFIIIQDLLFFLLGIQPDEGLSWIYYLRWILNLGTSIFFIYWSIRHYRNVMLNGALTFNQGVQVGIRTAFFLSLWAGIWTFLLLKYLFPGVFQVEWFQKTHVIAPIKMGVISGIGIPLVFVFSTFLKRQRNLENH